MKLSVGIGQGRDADRDGVSSSGLPCFGEGRADAHSSGPVSGGEIFPLFVLTFRVPLAQWLTLWIMFPGIHGEQARLAASAAGQGICCF